MYRHVMFLFPSARTFMVNPRSEHIHVHYIYIYMYIYIYIYIYIMHIYISYIVHTPLIVRSYVSLKLYF